MLIVWRKLLFLDTRHGLTNEIIRNMTIQDQLRQKDKCLKKQWKLFKPIWEESIWPRNVLFWTIVQTNSGIYTISEALHTTDLDEYGYKIGFSRYYNMKNNVAMNSKAFQGYCVVGINNKVDKKAEELKWCLGRRACRDQRTKGRAERYAVNCLVWLLNGQISGLWRRLPVKINC